MARLAGRAVVVVGGGVVATGKLAGLLDESARITVIAPEASEEIRAAHDEGRLHWVARAYQRGDLDGATLVVAATDDAGVNAEVLAEADDLGRLCVRIDGVGSADFAAAVRRDPLVIAIGTDGTAPSLARFLRERLERCYGPEYGALARLLGSLRQDPAVQATLRGLPSAQRRLKWRSVLETDILDLLRTGQSQAAREVAIACLSSSSD